ncbi:MAG TPA: 23S rRNA (pseudouridine(1915)-N(3))-methyltransferase RlmH [Polyangiaceae bacterium]|nr:23S rRNA (pseudouridine(1915)-N(3))-methyltransferase RlmH [Polyangiaceae bacterium]
MKFVVIAVGKQKSRELRAIADDYLSRLRRYVACDEREVQAAADLSGAIPNGAFSVALEVRGEALTSPELAARLERWSSRDKGIVAFLIGGADGIPKDVSESAGARISLSSLTLPHRLARIVLLEQLYRSMTILRGEPYARE